MRVAGINRASRGAQPPGALPAALLVFLALVVVGTADSASAANKKPRHGSKSASTSGEVYRWVDDKGVVHFGDQVPAEYAPIDRQVLNQYGVPLRTEQGALTEEEIAAQKKAEAEKKAALVAARRDEVLLSTYLSVEEIEALRDRRMELINGQFSVTKNYLESLKQRLAQLQLEAGNFKPYSQDPDAEPIDGKLAKELAELVDSIALYERTLVDTRNRQNRLVMAFDSDIARFKELRGL